MLNILASNCLLKKGFGVGRWFNSGGNYSSSLSASTIILCLSLWDVFPLTACFALSVLCPRGGAGAYHYNDHDLLISLISDNQICYHKECRGVDSHITWMTAMLWCDFSTSSGQVTCFSGHSGSDTGLIRMLCHCVQSIICSCLLYL